MESDGDGKGGLRLKAGSIADFLLGRVDRADSE